MNESTDAAQNLISENIYAHAVMDFQRFAGLNETGKGGLNEFTARSLCNPLARPARRSDSGHDELAPMRQQGQSGPQRGGTTQEAVRTAR